VMKKVPEAVSIFILPPSPQVLELRLRHRSQAEGVKDEAVIEERLGQARKELEMIASYQYALVNDVLEQAVSEMRAIVLCQRGEQCSGEVKQLAEGCETRRQSARLNMALKNFGVGIATLKAG
jgi:guanylate kinase